MDEKSFRASRTLRALGNPLRYRIMARLCVSPATAYDLSLGLRRPHSTISRHLAILRAADLVWFVPRNDTYLYYVKYEEAPAILAIAERFALAASIKGPDGQSGSTSEGGHS
jgi:hypothetical protein